MTARSSRGGGDPSRWIRRGIGRGLLALAAGGMLARADLRDNAYKPSGWYKEYPAYPAYCSTPEEMEHRGVPPLPNDGRLGETRLLHVTAVIRHGARTPWSSEEVCWEGYWDESADTSVWDCDLTTVMAPPDPNKVFVEEEDTNNADWLPDDAFFMFEKRYDALHYGSGLRNLLNGTCQRGQMLMRGYEQEIRNGRLLREAYAHLPNDYDHDERMRLIDLSLDNHAPWDPKHLYYRSDDDQRTEMSGQVVLRGLFDEEVMEQFFESGIYPHVKLHTADRNRDVLTANPGTCPRSGLLVEEAKQSEAYQAFNSSDAMETLRWFARDKLGMHPTGDGDLRLLDCLMTTICTDRNLPGPVDDYQGGRPSDRPRDPNEMSMFDALAQADIQRYNLLMQHNDAEPAKLAMGPLWAEILRNINPHLEDGYRRRRAEQQQQPIGAARALNNLPPPAPRLALFSGHDTTIIPLLTSLGPNVWNSTEWPPYASMVLIEIHELIDGISDKSVYTSDFAFRLLYNGKVLTSRIDGCPPDAQLCDIVHFKGLVDVMASRDPDCSVPPEPGVPNETIVQAKQLLGTGQGVAMFVGLVVFGLASGALGTYVLLTGRLPCAQRVLVKTSEEEAEEEDARRGLKEVEMEEFFDEPTTAGGDGLDAGTSGEFVQ